MYGSVYRFNYEAEESEYVEDFIAILDNKYYPIQAFDSSDNPVITNKICKLAYDEDGNIYGIDNQGTTANPVYRFIMLNNIAVANERGVYEVKLRRTYFFPNTMNTFNPSNLILKKSPTEALYFILGRNSTGSKLITTTLSIEVGSSNEWGQYDYSLSSNISNFNGVDMILTQTGDTSTGYIISLATKELIVCDTTDGMSGASIVSLCETPKSVVMVGANQFYYTDYGTNECTVRKYDTGAETDITQFPYTTTPNQDTLGYLKYINGLLFWVRVKNENSINYLTYGCYNDIATNEISVETVLFKESNISVPFHITNNFGIYAPCICNTPLVEPGTIIAGGYAIDYLYITTMLYYPGIYSGSEYEDYSALIPATCRMYGTRQLRTGILHDYDLVFARQLYNLTTNNNITTATTEVPNTYLNDLYLKKMSLFGSTTIDLADYEPDFDRTISKNIYEALYINFINTINVSDEDTSTDYRTTSVNITANTNNILNKFGDSTMNNKKIANLKVNWQDGTTSIYGVDIIQNNETDFTITGTIYINQLIDTIDINSSDNSQTYITLDASNLEVGNYYTLTQGLRIE